MAERDASVRLRKAVQREWSTLFYLFPLLQLTPRTQIPLLPIW